ncbi:MAG TPA: copper resistance protein CopC [Actinomycetota bacterium]|nr:copper resistance protein CopC [Actinomycetota bacterium]
MRPRGRLAALAPLAGLWLLATGPAAAAHGALRSSDPAGGSSLDRAPSAVTLRFTERPDPGLSTVRVLDSSGRVVAGGPARPVPGRPAELRLPLAGLPAGGYTVSWRIVSAVDGHRTDGVFGFGVGPAAAPRLPAARAVAGVRTDPAPAPLAVAGRWAWYWGLALLAGAAATGLLVFGGRLPGRPALLLGLALAAAAAGLAAMTVAARADTAVPIGDLLASTTGHWLLWRAATLAAAGGAAWWVTRRAAKPPATEGTLPARPGTSGALVALGVAAGAGMLVHALAGHAAGPSSLRLLNLLAQWAHLLAVGVWIGGLAWLLAALWSRGAVWSTREVVVRYSRLAGISLAVVVLTGVARTVDELGGWGRLADSGFGRALDLKLVLFAGLVALGALSRYRIVPLFRAGARRRATARLRRSVGAELGLAAAVLAAAALLSQLAPGVPSGSGTARPGPSAPPVLRATGSDWATTVKVSLTVTPGAAGPNRFTAVVADFDTGGALLVDRVELAGTPLSHPDLGTARLELTEAPDGRWLGQGRLLSLAGRWNLTTTIQQAGGGVVVPLAVDVPPSAPS